MMESLRNYEKKVISLLVSDVLSFEEINSIVCDGELVGYEYTGGGYVLEISHPLLPKKKIVCDKPIVIGQADDIVCRFIIFIENSRLTIECLSWGALNVTKGFRYNDVQVEAVTVEKQPDCPLQFCSFTSIGSSIDSILKVDIKNISNKPIHSFSVTYHSREPAGHSIGGWGHEILLPPGQSYTLNVSCKDKRGLRFSIDFVQFATGDVWYAEPPRASVKPEGVQAGEQAAIEYLHKVLESDGAPEVMIVLLHVRTKMGLWKFSSEEDFGCFGFDHGIIKAVVSVQHAYQEGGLPDVEDLLRHTIKDTSQQTSHWVEDTNN